jgi:multidrug efflux pump subunit AcrB
MKETVMLNKFEIFLTTMLQSKTRKAFFLLTTLLAFFVSVYLLPAEIVLAKMLPGKNNDTFNIYVTMKTGSSIEQTKEVSECVIDYIIREDEVLNTELFLGEGSPLDFAGLIKGSHFKNSENVSEIVVNITKAHHRKEPSYMMVQRLRSPIQKNCENLYDSTKISFVEPPSGPPVLAAVVAEVYGDNEEGIRKLSFQVEEIFTKTSGLVDIDIMHDDIYDSYEVIVNSSKIARSGLSIKQVNNILYLAFEGMQIAVKNSRTFDDQIPIYLTIEPDKKRFSENSVEAINAKLSSLKLMNAMGMMVPITEVVSLVKVTSNPMIMSKNLHQMSNVMAETDMVSQVYPLIESRSTMLDTLSKEYTISKIGLFDLELQDKKSLKTYKIIFDGEMKVTIDTFIELGGAFIAALILIFLLMVVYYKSFVLSGIVLLGSFLSIVGVIVGHFIMDLFTVDTFFLTATSLIGFIALIGISSRNTILLLDFTKSLIHNKGMHKQEAVAYATATRAKPILLTAAAIILASTLLASDAVFGGLGVSLIFGTIAAVVASLIIVPILIDNSNLEKHFGYSEKKSLPIFEE